MPLPTLEIRMLGPFRVAVDGRPVEPHEWRRRTVRTLIKRLALHRHHQLHAEELQELLWPELDFGLACKNLYRVIYVARRVLEPHLGAAAESQFLVMRNQQVLLRAPDRFWIDVEAFAEQAELALREENAEAGERALALYEGDLLIEDPYEDWCAMPREQLRTLRCDVQRLLARLYEARGEAQRSLDVLEQLVAADPLDEDAHRRRMRLYAAMGDRHRAGQQFQRCCQVLRQELDAEPEPATRALYEQILAGQIRPQAAAPEAVARAGAAGCAPPDPDVLDRPVRRTFTAEYKLRILAECDVATEPGQIGRILRREGLSRSHLSDWRAARDRGDLAGFAPRPRGPRSRRPMPEHLEVARLTRELARLHEQLEKAELIIALQRKTWALVGTALPAGPRTESYS